MAQNGTQPGGINLPRVEYLKVSELFGYQSREVHFLPEGPTIFTGPNGSGKTQTLRLIQALLRLNVSQLARLPFGEAQLRLTDGTVLAATRRSIPKRSTASVQLIVRKSSQAEKVKTSISLDEIERFERERLDLIPRLETVGKDAYYWNGQRISFEVARQIHSERVDIQLPRNIKYDVVNTRSRLPESLQHIRHSWPRISCIIVDTRRLDPTEVTPIRRALGSSRGFIGERPFRRIEIYLDQIGRQMEAARRRAIRENQESDSSFAARALDAAHDEIDESELRSVYMELVSRSEALARNELHFGAPPPPLREAEMNITERRILSVFLEDWKKRIEPLEPVNEKIELFRELLDSKLKSSFKRTESIDSGIEIVDFYGDKINVSNLSSGEQHLVALFTRLLFDTKDGAVVLIDEPEISLHPAWQHEFIDDLERIQEKTGAQWVIATHSPAIVNSRWELETPLKIERPPRGTNAPRGPVTESFEYSELDFDELEPNE